MSNIKVQAEILRRGLYAGFIQPAEVVAWADREIEICDTPGPELIEVSLGGGLHTDELVRALSFIPGQACESQVVSMVIRRMANALQQDANLGQCIIRELYQMLIDDLIYCPGAQSEIYRLDDAFCLAESRIWGEIEMAQMELKEFLMIWNKNINDSIAVSGCLLCVGKHSSILPSPIANKSDV